MYPSTSTQQPAAICALKSPGDAIHILEAVRLGVVPRVTRRLTGHERSMIRPGTVWVWEEEETNMRRWTDGRRWGASRVGGGGFLVYTETSESHSPPPSRPESPGHYGYPPNQYYPPPPQMMKRPESLIKQTYSTTMTNQATGKVKKFHVVAYSSKHNPQGDAFNPLPLPHQLPLLANIKVAPGIWPEWESRRDSDAAKKQQQQQNQQSQQQQQQQGTATPGGGATPGQPNPVTAMPPPESPMSAGGPAGEGSGVGFPPTAYPAPPQHPGGRSPLRGAGGYDRAGQPAYPPQHPGQQQGYNPAPYFYPPPPTPHDRNDMYDSRQGGGGPGPAPGMPSSAERYHPYAGRPRQPVSAYPQPGGGPSAPYPTDMSQGGLPTPVTPGEGYYDGDRRHQQHYMPYQPPHGGQGYPQPQYGREFYPDVAGQQPEHQGEQQQLGKPNEGQPQGATTATPATEGVASTEATTASAAGTSKAEPLAKGSAEPSAGVAEAPKNSDAAPAAGTEAAAQDEKTA